MSLQRDEHVFGSTDASIKSPKCELLNSGKQCEEALYRGVKYNIGVPGTPGSSVNW